MELPAIKIPQIELPFDIPVLLHPPVDHFIIALPVIILLLELVNIVFKKRAIGVTSFFLLILTVVAAAAAYLTGSVDGKEAFPLLNEVAQGELKEHKLLGTYLMLASVVVLLFKLLSSMINRGLMKALYLFILILFVVGILKQGKEGGELVYEYGVNVEKVQTLDNELDDLKEELEELQEENKEDVPTVQAAETVKAAEVVVVEETVTEAKESVKVKAEAVKTEVTEVIEETQAKVNEAEEKTQAVEAEAIKAVDGVEEKASEVTEKVEVLEEKIEAAVEVVPESAPQVQIATH